MQGHTVTGDGGTPPDPVEDQVGEDQVVERVDEVRDDAAEYARIEELRGRGASVSGAY